MKKPLVSVITPSFNQGQFIEDTIKSVLNQTYDNIEYIVIDGASTDNTLSILEKYHSKLKFISEKDAGQANAINKGFKMAKGMIVGWINSDDILETNTVEAVVEEFIKNDRLAIVYGNIVFINEFNERIRFSGLDSQRFPNVSLDYLLHKKPAITQPGSFYSLNLVKKVGLLDESLNYAMDYDLWIKLLMEGDIQYLDMIMAKFRVHSSSKTISQQPGFTSEICKVVQKYGGSLNVVPSNYLKQNHYGFWSNMLRPKLLRAFHGASGKRIGIYGIGGHTLGMLELYKKLFGNFDFEIFYFDSNPNNWGKSFCGGVIYKPDVIDELQLDRIIISSYTYQNEIYAQIEKYATDNLKIVKLYNEDDNIYFI